MNLNHYVIIDGDRYFVPDDGAVESVRKELLDAVQSGGGYVALGRAGVGYTEVLVTAATAIRIEHVSVETSPAAGIVGDADVDPGWWV